MYHVLHPLRFDTPCFAPPSALPRTGTAEEATPLCSLHTEDRVHAVWVCLSAWRKRLSTEKKGFSLAK